MGKENFTDVPTHFTGACNCCGEVYQASSKLDDLEGVGFGCKKSTCTGRVTLKVSSIGHIRTEKSDKSKSSRLC